MKRFALKLSYKGTKFHGWQVQKGSITVQENINNALKTLLDEDIETIGCGRTDTGVHAKNFVAHFDTNFPEKINSFFLYHLNSLLDFDIAVNNVFEVSPDFNARFDAVSRKYYYIINSQKDPFTKDFEWFYFGELNKDSMNQAASILLKHKDFTSFCKLHGNSKNNICDVRYAKWRKVKTRLIFTIEADRFLRNMVRSIVGTLIEVGKNKLTLEQFEEIINSKNRSNAGTSVPAKGLFLAEIKY